MIKIKRQPKRSDECYKHWEKAPAFAVNPRGILVHRVRYVQTLRKYGRAVGDWSHNHVAYWCGNGTCFDLEWANQRPRILTDTPPKDRLLCDFCESAAKRKGKQSSDKLAGRHVHRGVLKAHQVCCGAKP